MPRLPIISGEEVIAALERAGFRRIRQKKHVSMGKLNPTIVVTVPLHKSVKRGTLRAIIRDSGLTVEQFVSLLG
jgi:predicted RNA binding protein YcfA (HicA-like mRNA interferase family)